MKQQAFTKAILLLAFLCSAMKLPAQDDCTFKPFFTLDFGSGKDIADVNFFPLARYKRAYSTCPNDGFYSYSSATSNCFNNDWLTFYEDHTPGDEDGRMMLVNASPEGGIFFNFLV